VRNKVDLTASDEWARITGYYIAKIDGKDEPFAFLSDALRAVDSHTVTVLGTQTKEKDLNLPGEHQIECCLLFIYILFCRSQHHSKCFAQRSGYLQSLFH
jgi:hypothetical protein